MKVKQNHPWRRRQRIRAGVRILKRMDAEYGTRGSWQNLENARMDLKLAVAERWK